jgi:hypothetical protein
MALKTVLVCIMLSLCASTAYSSRLARYFSSHHRRFDYGSFSVKCPSLSSSTTKLGVDSPTKASVTPPNTNTGYVCTLSCNVNNANWDGKSVYALDSTVDTTVQCTGSCQNTAGYRVSGTCNAYRPKATTSTSGGSSGFGAYCPAFHLKVKELDINGGQYAAPKLLNPISGANCFLKCKVNGTNWDFASQNTYPLIPMKLNDLSCTATCQTSYGNYVSSCSYSGYPAY